MAKFNIIINRVANFVKCLFANRQKMRYNITMTKELSEQISGEIAYIIAEQAPYVDYTSADVKKTERNALPSELTLTGGDSELYHVIHEFLHVLHVDQAADRAYLNEVYKNARKYTKAQFYADPFLKNIHVPTCQIGDFTLTTVSYGRGELFQYDQPDLAAKIVVPKLAFCTDEVFFPTLYEGNIPWMSACPSEINSMKSQMNEAFGRVLVLGLGLGYYPYIVAQKPEVTQVDIIEIEPTIIQMFRQAILPQFPDREKIHVIKADAFAYLDSVQDGDYDFVFADIWENQFDGSKAYLKIVPQEKRLPHTKFTYWLEEQIKWVLRG